MLSGSGAICLLLHSVASRPGQLLACLFCAGLALFLSGASLACSPGVVADPGNSSRSSSPGKDSSSSGIESRYSYDQDFANIKEAILNKDIPGLAAYASSDAIDAELIIQSFHADPEYIRQLKSFSYKDLKVEDGGLVLSVMVSGSDEEGNEYESGLYLYFSQGEPNLELVNFLAAG